MSKKISDLISGSPVVTSAETDEYETAQGGVSKGALGSQILTVPTLHVNKSTVIALSVNAQQTLLDGAASRALVAGNVIEIIGFGVFLDPTTAGPNCIIRVKVAGTTVIQATLSASFNSWYFHATLSVFAGGVSGSISAGMFFITGVGNIGLVSASPTVVNLTGTPTIDVTSETDNVTGTEGTECDQLIIRKTY
jgi:hypothetical protein